MQEFVFSNDFYKNIDLMVYTSGHEQCVPGHSYGPAVRSSYMIHYIHSGKGIYQTGGKTYHLKAGDFFLITPGTRIFYQADEQDPWTYSWIGLQGIKTKEYLERTCLEEIVAGPMPEDSRIPGFFQEIRTLSSRDNGDLLYNAAAYVFIYDLIQDFPAVKQKKSRTPAEYAREILTYIEQNFDQGITVASIADHFALDRSYMHRIFKHEIGTSVKDYMLSLQLANACSYLIYSDLSVSEISRSVGFEDVLYFSKLFSRKKGKSPTRYRMEKRQELQITPKDIQSENQIPASENL